MGKKWFCAIPLADPSEIAASHDIGVLGIILSGDKFIYYSQLGNPEVCIQFFKIYEQETLLNLFSVAIKLVS